MRHMRERFVIFTLVITMIRFAQIFVCSQWVCVCVVFTRVKDDRCDWEMPVRERVLFSQIDDWYWTVTDNLWEHLHTYICSYYL